MLFILPQNPSTPTECYRQVLVLTWSAKLEVARTDGANKPTISGWTRVCVGDFHHHWYSGTISYICKSCYQHVGCYLQQTKVGYL